MRRGSVFVLVTIALAACGLDAVGIDPDGGVTPAVDSGDAGPVVDAGDGAAEGDADAPYLPTIDAGAAEVVIEGIVGLRTITMVGTKLVVGRDGEALVVDPEKHETKTLPGVRNARAMVGTGTEVYFVNQIGPASSQIGHAPISGIGQTALRGETLLGIDIAMSGAKEFGAYTNRVVSYNGADLNGPETRSDGDGTPLGVVANGTAVYWTDGTSRALLKDSLTVVGPPTAVLNDLDEPTSLELDGAWVYIATATNITQTSLTTAGTRVFAGGLRRPVSLAIDAALKLYWIDRTDGLLKRGSTQTPGVETIGTCQPFTEPYPKLIAFDTTHVYWASPNEGKVFRRKK